MLSARWGKMAMMYGLLKSSAFVKGGVRGLGADKP